ncbi:MAG: hypothetical protein JWN86_3943 [Planctomycetota bacterium]|nr:hypothetical protein [Planctomycetota bacterium]
MSRARTPRPARTSSAASWARRHSLSRWSGGGAGVSVEVDLYEAVDRDPDAFLLDLSRRLAGHEDLIDLDYKCVGSRRNILFLEVSGVDEAAATRTRHSEVTRIALSVLGIDSLADHGSDRLDFVELGRSAIREALAASYEAGREAGAG